MTIKTFRAVEQGFHLGRLIQADATFTVDLDAYEDETGDAFEPNWAVEIDDGHKPTPDNVGEQEALEGVLDRDAALPQIAHPDQPLPEFHPALALSVAQANAENGDKTVPVKTTAEILAEQAAQQGTPAVETPAAPKPRRRTKRPDSNTVDTGTDASDAEKADAKEASEAEKKADDAKGDDDEDGNDFV